MRCGEEKVTTTSLESVPPNEDPLPCIGLSTTAANGKIVAAIEQATEDFLVRHKRGAVFIWSKC